MEEHFEIMDPGYPIPVGGLVPARMPPAARPLNRPVLIEYKQMRFLISDAPSDSNLVLYMAVKLWLEPLAGHTPCNGTSPILTPLLINLTSKNPFCSLSNHQPNHRSFNVAKSSMLSVYAIQRMQLPH